eukprot:Gregarina_sp_Pseudo_9__5866@NODE_913_length_2066_cov_72_967933_g857_i0_p3_GENE_NODE_913_length_2066_cov_72_967933_g857_i0NODE_913_length_2066_cov_72_967933_g857_i0_p3_ORF_typecomplete_len118_score28_07_NODE_913_length_2066_cov_72_967933_g857_i017112022
MADNNNQSETRGLNRAISNSFENPASFAREILKARSLSNSAQALKMDAAEDLTEASAPEDKLDEVAEEEEQDLSEDGEDLPGAKSSGETTKTDKPLEKPAPVQ